VCVITTGIALLARQLDTEMNLAINPDRHAPAWLVWLNLWIVYIVWGSTYLAIRVMVETMPPLLASGVRFLAAGAIAYVYLWIRRGRAGVRVTRSEFLASAAVGTALLLGGNGLVSIAERDVPSGLAALVIASTPLWVVVLRALFGDRIPGGTLLGVLVGFIGVGILVIPGRGSADAPLYGLILLVIAAALWASGSFFSKRLPLPRDPFLSTVMQMLAGGGILMVAGLARGEAGQFVIAEFSARSMTALLYLIFIGSLVAFTAYTWLLQHAPISKVATYAYVNPVIAIFLGAIILSEEITAFILVGAALIVASVAFIVSKESTAPRRKRSVDAAPEAALAASDVQEVRGPVAPRPPDRVAARDSRAPRPP
jgi:drug/metabolite transporter (DMT)-like permease